MVIFGAGASYDSSPTYPPPEAISPREAREEFRPPLADQLFSNRPLFADAIRSFPECRAIVPHLQILRETTLEAVLEKIRSETDKYPRGHKQLAAVRCYLHLVIRECQRQWEKVTGGVTNYRSLINIIDRSHKGNDPVCLVTFNYDTLLEEALVQFGLVIQNISDYTTKHPFYKVFKLHGSVNWAHDVQSEIHDTGNAWAVLNEIIDRTPQIEITDTFNVVNSFPIGFEAGKPSFPALAVPFATKGIFECPSVVIDELVDLLPEVTKLLLIGWRATDTHFLELLSRHLRPGVQLCVVAGPDDFDEIKTRMYRALFNKFPVVDSVVHGFTEFVIGGEAERFLIRIEV